MGVRLIGVHFIGVYLTGVHPICEPSSRAPHGGEDPCIDTEDVFKASELWATRPSGCWSPLERAPRGEKLPKRLPNGRRRPKMEVGEGRRGRIGFSRRLAGGLSQKLGGSLKMRVSANGNIVSHCHRRACV